MSSIAFPQLSSGAQVQYPLRKNRILQGVLNAFADGSMIASDLNTDDRFIWELAYKELTDTDQTALQNLFYACQGPLRSFIFIDPTANMLTNSSNLTIGSWAADPLLQVTGGQPDPLGGNNAFELANAAQIDQRLTQFVAVPANYWYCLSLYASAAVPSALSLGSFASLSSNDQQQQSFALGNNWMRLVNSSQLSSTQIGLTFSIIVPAAQTILVYGPQAEPQLSPSRYRATAALGGVNPNSHLLGNSLTFDCDAPGLYSTLITIETT